MDGWSDDFYPANRAVLRLGPIDRPAYGNPNALQMNLRKILTGEQMRKKNILEKVHHHSPPIFAPGFCLARAREKSPKGIQARYPDGVTAADAEQAAATM